ncbi:MAG: DNA repair protein RadA [Clostridiales Family XIII bacterium]|jgi:DNA repair protein RadA/Sms|nr:DNA repair protein RadA [Clostridiales Family XIII bacterium]
MAKRETVFVCGECGYESAKWMGQCVCGAWNSFTEERIRPADSAPSRLSGNNPRSAVAALSRKPVPLRDVTSGAADRIDTGIGELNRVLGGGLTKGTLTLIAGEPGIGKSTLILQAALHMAARGLTCLYVSGEESAEQIRMRADRLAASIPEGVLMLNETDVDAVCENVLSLRPDFLVIDSIQTMYTGELSSAAGGVSQIRACADVFMRIGKEYGIPVFIVAHVTKAGELAGPKVIEHLVDCVLAFSGERERDFRLLTASKNRFGTTSEVGAFDMREDGLAEITDLSGILLDSGGFGGGADDGGARKAEGTIVTGVYEGTRPLLMELQALTAHAGSGFPRRTALGVDGARLAMLLAVLEKKAGLYLGDSDVYVNIVGGLRPEGTAIDLACALAVWSSAKSVPIPYGTLAVGEIGLSGEIRSVRHTDRIAAEAAGLGFKTLILPAKNAEKTKPPKGLALVPVKSIQDAIAALMV